jgi:hypothetical protein
LLELVEIVELLMQELLVFDVQDVDDEIALERRQARGSFATTKDVTGEERQVGGEAASCPSDFLDPFWQIEVDASA